MSKDPEWGGLDSARGSDGVGRRAAPAGAPAVRWIANALVIAVGLYWLHGEQARQAAHQRILREGVATTGVVADAITDWRTGDEGGYRYFLVVRYYTDGLPGPPRPLHPAGGILEEWGMPPMPEMRLPGAKRMQAAQREPPGPGTYPPPLPFDTEVSVAGGRVVMHPVCAGKVEVPGPFYDQAPVGQTVAVRYLPSQPSTFVLVDQPTPNNIWWICTLLGLVGLGMVVQLWRTYLR
jgi:hypothetical protein